MKRYLIALTLGLAACSQVEPPTSPVAVPPNYATALRIVAADTTALSVLQRTIDAPQFVPGPEDSSIAAWARHFNDDWKTLLTWWLSMTPEARAEAMHNIRYYLALQGITGPYMWEDGNGNLHQTTSDGTSDMMPLR